MRHYSCDVCGMPMPKSYERRNKTEFRIAVLAGVEDVCSVCEGIGRGIDVAAVLKAHWCQLAALKADEEKEREEKDIPLIKFTGAAGNEKAEILQQLIAYKNAHGLGSLNKIANRTGGAVTDTQLRSLIYDGTSLDISKFRKVKKALEGLEQEAASE